jgi:DNA-binding GntR family transcriptional regulator
MQGANRGWRPELPKRQTQVTEHEAIIVSSRCRRQQEAIKAIEVELNRLCQVGDKSANLISILPL